MSYKRLGDYIKRLNERNTRGEISYLLGVNLDKEFMPSVANTIGTDMTKYKIIRKGQFGCKLMSVGRDGKLPISRLMERENALLSSAYFVFKVSDESVLLPEYLMMWFKRPETDRYLWFLSGGDVRGRVTWEDFKSIPIKIPSIEKQREIVADYQAVENKIKTNEAICEKLEETAQTIYRRWFEEFEFPDKEGKPYKSNGGKMVWNEELEKDIPIGWKLKKIVEVAKIYAGGDRPRRFSKTKKGMYTIPVISNSSKNYGIYGFTNKPKIEEPSITVSARGAIIGFTVFRQEPFYPIVRVIVITPNNMDEIFYLFRVIVKFTYPQTASAQGQLTVPEIGGYSVLKPNKDITKSFYRLNKKLNNLMNISQQQNQKLCQLQSLLLGRMTREEKLINEK